MIGRELMRVEEYVYLQRFSSKQLLTEIVRNALRNYTQVKFTLDSGKEEGWIPCCN